MNLVLLLDPEIDLNVLNNRKGPWFNWFDSYILEALRHLNHDVHPVHFGPDIPATIEQLQRIRPELVFNLSEHAFNDRDKRFYAATLLELLGLPYTGCGPKGLMLTQDKGLTNTILRRSGISVPNFAIYPHDAAGLRQLKYPVLVKPATLGGSEGLTRKSLVRNLKALEARAGELCTRQGCDVICEEYVVGRELSVGVLGDQKLKVLPAGEWHFGSSRESPQFVTERVKWDDGYRKRWGITYEPAELPPRVEKKLRSLCHRIYRLLELRDYASVDLRLTADGALVVLDVNSNPGLWPGSGRWKSMPFGDLVTLIIKMASARARAANGRS